MKLAIIIVAMLLQIFGALCVRKTVQQRKREGKTPHWQKRHYVKISINVVIFFALPIAYMVEC